MDWATLLLFMALFMLVGTLQEIGLISYIASGIHDPEAGNLFVVALFTV